MTTTITASILAQVDQFRAEALDNLKAINLPDDLTVQLHYHTNRTIDDVVARAIAAAAAPTCTPVASIPNVYYPPVAN